MSDARKNQLKIAKARAAYREHLRELQADGLVLSVDDPHNLTAFGLAGEASLVGAVWAGDRTSAVVVVGDDGETRLDAARSGSAPVAPAVHPQLGAAVPIYQLTAVEVEFDERDEDAVQDLRLVFRLPSAPATNVELRVDCILPKEATRATLMTFQTPLASSELVTHLDENALHYSQQVWLSLDPGTLTVHLARYSYRGSRLIEQIDPTPLSAAGNCLVFRWKAEEAQAWKDWTAANVDTSSVSVDLVALPTGGVFAEAVLGRFNAAEKLDLTRFWNWQDSPIPIQAPEIAALQAGQRVVAESTTPGDLDAPVVTIQNPQPLPDPTGLSGALAALTAANLFRDMSNGSATAALAQAALQASAQGAQGIAAQAGANMATAGQFTLEMTKALAAAALGIPAAPGPALGNVSTAGAAINHGARMDAAAAQAPNPLPLDGAGPPAGGSPVPGAGPPVLTASTGPSQERTAFARALGVPLAQGATAHNPSVSPEAGAPVGTFPTDDGEFVAALVLAKVKGPLLLDNELTVLPDLHGVPASVVATLPVADGVAGLVGVERSRLRQGCTLELSAWERFAERQVTTNVVAYQQAIAAVLTEQAVESILADPPGIDVTTSDAVTVATGLIGLGLTAAFRSTGLVGDAVLAAASTIAGLAFNHWSNARAVADLAERRQRLLLALAQDTRISSEIVSAVYQVDTVADFYASWLGRCPDADLLRFRIPSAPEVHDEAAVAGQMRPRILAGAPPGAAAIAVPRSDLEVLQLLTRFGLGVQEPRQLHDLLTGRPIRTVVRSIVRMPGGVFRPPAPIEAGDIVVLRTSPLDSNMFGTAAPEGIVFVHERTGHATLLRFADGLFHEPPVDL